MMLFDCTAKNTFCLPTVESMRSVWRIPTASQSSGCSNTSTFEVAVGRKGLQSGLRRPWRKNVVSHTFKYEVFDIKPTYYISQISNHSQQKFRFRGVSDWGGAAVPPTSSKHPLVKVKYQGQVLHGQFAAARSAYMSHCGHS